MNGMPVNKVPDRLQALRKVRLICKYFAYGVDAACRALQKMYNVQCYMRLLRVVPKDGMPRDDVQPCCQAQSVLEHSPLDACKRCQHA